MIKVLVNNINSIDVLLCLKVSILTGRKFSNWFMFWMSKSGDGYIYIVIALAAILVDYTTGKDITFIMIIAFAIELIIQKSVKHLIKRERPGSKIMGISYLINPPDRFSFPSGHTAGAFLTAVILCHFSVIIALPVFVWAVLVGFSRIYNGVHYPSDVVIGAILGVLSGELGIYLYCL